MEERKKGRWKKESEDERRKERKCFQKREKIGLFFCSGGGVAPPWEAQGEAAGPPPPPCIRVWPHAMVPVLQVDKNNKNQFEFLYTFFVCIFIDICG